MDFDSNRRKSVLLVEDDADMRAALRVFLQENGYQVEMAENGKDALKILEYRQPGLVLLDLMMPLMNGWEFLEKKNKTPEIMKIPVVVISGIKGEVYVPGVLTALKKPLDFERVMDFVELYCG